MTNEMFETVQKNLVFLMDDCLKMKNEIPNKEAFRELSLKQAEITVNRARELQKKQDKFFTTELYHVLGMGDLTPTQELFVLKVSRIILDTRSYIKAIAGIGAFPTIPNIPTKADYNCSLLGINLNKEVNKEAK